MRKYNKSIIITLLVLISTSCSNWLTLAPEEGVTREEFWQTKEQVASAVVGCYASLMDGPVEKMFMWGELRADMIDNGNKVDANFLNVIDGEISASNSVVNWADFYQTINNCNLVLKYAPNVLKTDGTFTQQQLKAYEAEALTIRAMMYFYLVRSFKDVPLMLTAAVTDDQTYAIPKTSGTVILDSLVSDLKIAIANAPIAYSSTSQNKTHVTMWTAKTLLADIYLWQENYEACNKLCDEVIGSGRFSLIKVRKSYYQVTDGGIVDTVSVANEADAESFFNNSYVTGNSVESIFEIPFTSIKNNPFYSILSPSSCKLKPKSDIVEGLVFPDPLYASAQDATDIRSSGCSYRLGYIWKYVGDGRSGSPRFNANYTTPWLVYKYSDILLMKAEALNQLGLKTDGDVAQGYYTKSVASMNLVRSARNAVETSDYNFQIPINGTSLEAAILDERSREFAYEGKRWYDVLRYAKRDNYGGNNIQYLNNLAIRSAAPEKQQSLIAKYKDPKHNSHYWPIYVSEIEANKELKQNEFYAQ